MERDFRFDSGWPVALVFGLLIVFTLGLTPSGREMISKLGKAFSSEPKPQSPPPLQPRRPDVLVATANSDDQKTVAATVIPRGYNVLFAETTAIARQFLHSDANRIGLIVVNAESRDARPVADLALSLVPDARLIKLPPRHGATEVATLLLAAI